MSLKALVDNTTDITEEVGVIFQRCLPDWHARYMKAFQAGRWYDSDPGPFLGQAYVWKVQVEPHRDGKDGGPAAMFPCGYYTGGALYFPNLWLKLAYILRSHTGMISLILVA
jgi:hypothetical protein